jgi:hypothetical protein
VGQMHRWVIVGHWKRRPSQVPWMSLEPWSKLSSRLRDEMTGGPVVRKEIRIPELGMSEDNVVILAWLKAEGDFVARGEAVVEVETEKVTMPIEATEAGILEEIVARVGEEVPQRSVIGILRLE